MLAACWVVFVALPALVLGVFQIYLELSRRYPSTHTVALAVLLAAFARQHVWAAAMAITPICAATTLVYVDGRPRSGPRIGTDRVEPRLSPQRLLLGDRRGT
jgi:hypothetical protein